MGPQILGLHHMTAISGPASENLDFYSRVLGLRLVKLTVNFDDLSAHHLYYGNAEGTPGSILTFFPYPNGYPGRAGTGQATVTTLSVPPGSLPFWTDHFRANEVDLDRVSNRHAGQVIPFRAPDGLQLELMASADHVTGPVWARSPIPAKYAINGMRSVTLTVKDLGPTERVLVDILGFRRLEDKDHHSRFEVGEGGPSQLIDVSVTPEGLEARGGHGSVHHIAFRIGTEAEQLEKREELLAHGFHVSPVMDRTYFKSIYFRDPSGILFEIATDLPGFAVDEAEDSLGTSLKLPPQYEMHRGQIERQLPRLKLPTGK
jgi:glyoxalase family protein